jgi:hypothetical protein
VTWTESSWIRIGTRGGGLVNIVMKLWVSQDAGKFLNSCLTGWFSTRTQLHGACYYIIMFLSFSSVMGRLRTHKAKPNPILVYDLWTITTKYKPSVTRGTTIFCIYTGFWITETNLFAILAGSIETNSPLMCNYRQMRLVDAETRRGEKTTNCLTLRYDDYIIILFIVIVYTLILILL